MSQEQPSKITGLYTRRFKAYEALALLKVPFRRKVIRSLASGGMKTAEELNGGSGQTSAACRKQLTELCKARILVKKENRAQVRKPLYGLAHDIGVCQGQSGFTVDFGGCKLRF